jgi:oxygen-independent coproporphyrinogen-3 oxidase
MGGSLYVHIPFCARRCVYCDFVSGIYEPGQAAAYMEALEREITRLPIDGPVSTLYIGGGTPTVLSADLLTGLVNAINTRFGMADDYEATIEANPGTVDKEKLGSLRNAGINRISIGVQSFNDDELEILGRIHSSDQAVRAVKDAREAGFENIGIDLIYGIPGQCMDDWKKTLEQATRLQPQHVSTYELTVEEDTPLSEMIEARSISKPLPEEETIVMMYDHTIDYLSSAGYHHYEISNFALPTYECRHNLNYWDRGEYYGAGLGAHSLVDGYRIKNTSSMKRYLQSHHGDHVDDREHLSPRQEISEAIFLGMRRTSGICLERFAKRYGVNIMQRYEKEIERLSNAGLVEIASSECFYETCLRLTRKGLRLSNEVFEKFL